MQYSGEKRMEKAPENGVKPKKKEFSKRLIFWEGLLVTAISGAGLYIAHLSVISAYTGALPWVTAMVTSAWGAYGVSQAFYYNKAKAENVLKINRAADNPNNEQMRELN